MMSEPQRKGFLAQRHQARFGLLEARDFSANQSCIHWKRNWQGQGSVAAFSSLSG
jgi:hypothetical protein